MDIELLWGRYAELGSMATNDEKLKEAFEQQISAFSYFLSEVDPDYHYNGTYLPCYIDEFWGFVLEFNRKYPYVKRIFAEVSGYCDVSVIIDRYWQQECTWDEEKSDIIREIKLYPSFGKHMVCEKEIFIECSILCEGSRFIEQIKIQNNEEEVTKGLRKLVDFLDKKSDKK